MMNRAQLVVSFVQNPYIYITALSEMVFWALLMWHAWLTERIAAYYHDLSCGNFGKDQILLKDQF